jgi:polysaccharide biosynthesis transport protein
MLFRCESGIFRRAFVTGPRSKLVRSDNQQLAPRDPYHGVRDSYSYAAPFSPIEIERTQSNDLRLTWGALWRLRWQILAITCLFTGVSIIIMSLLPVHFVAEARLLVGIEQPEILRGPDQPAAVSDDGETTRAQNEMYVVLSRDLARQLVNLLKLDKNPFFNRVVQNSPNTGGGTLENWHQTVRRLVRPITAVIGIGSLNSEEGRSEQDSGTHNFNRPLQETIIDELLNVISVTPLGRSNVLSIQADTGDPELSATLVNSLAKMYIEEQRDHQIEDTRHIEDYMNSRIAELRLQVQSSEQAVEDYRKRFGLYRTTTSDLTAQQLGDLSSQLMQAEGSKAEANAKVGTLAGGAAGSEDSTPDVLQSPLVQSLKVQVADADRKLAELTATLGPRHPKVLNAKAAAAALERKLTTEIFRTVKSIRRQADVANGRYASLAAALQSSKLQMGIVNDKTIHLEALERDASVNRKLLEEMLSREKQMIGRQAVLQPNAKIISPAAPPVASSTPPKAVVILLGTVCGAFIGALFALWRDSADRTFRRAEEIAAVTGLPVLSVIPKRRPRRLLTEKDITSPYGEAMRRLAVGIALSTTSEFPRTILMTSPSPADGKTSAAVAFACWLAKSHKRVLLIDCDWRSPAVHKIFGVPNLGGLELLLRGSQANYIDEIVKDSKTKVDYVCAGTWDANDAHRLASATMNDFLISARSRYDIVILDTPPILPCSDVLLLTRLVEKTVMVVRWGCTVQDDVLQALSQLSNAGANMAGICLSGVNSRQYRKYRYKSQTYSDPRPYPHVLGNYLSP